MPFPNPATQFKPGQSGNPKGRTKPTYRQRAELILERTAKDKDIREIVKVVLEKAKAGDPWAVDMALKRLLPVTERREVEQVDPAPVAALEAALDRLDAALGAGTPPAKPNGAGTNGAGRGAA